MEQRGLLRKMAQHKHSAGRPQSINRKRGSFFADQQMRIAVAVGQAPPVFAVERLIMGQAVAIMAVGGRRVRSRMAEDTVHHAVFTAV